VAESPPRTRSPSSHQLGSGRASRAADCQRVDTSTSSRPQRGQVSESARHSEPAPAHTTGPAACPAAHTVIGSSALANTVVPGSVVSAAPIAAAVLRTSAARSSLVASEV